jgi:hypothetical protein
MPGQVKADPALVRRFVYLLLVAFIPIIVENENGLHAQRNPQTKTSQSSQSAVVVNVLKTSFGSALEAANKFKPFYLTGDFNGDGAQDILIVARIKGQRTELAGDVKIYNPFERPKAVYPDDPTSNPTLALAIIHGGRAGWQTPPALEKFLLFGSSPVLILNNARLISSEAQDKQSLMELKKKSAKRRGDDWPPLAAKGDSIILGTEATDSILYWNGKNYRWEEAADGE